MNITFLEARVPLTKKFTATSKEPYPNAFEFKSHTYTVKNLAHLHQLMTSHASKGHCLLKGTLTKELEWESRAGSTNPHAHTRFVCLDIDGLASITVIDDFLKAIGLSGVSYINQYSASYRMNGDLTLRTHIFIFLSDEIAASSLKTWLKQINLTIFNSELSLTKTNTALKWPVDITTCQNDKLLFIAPPRCEPVTIDPFVNGAVTGARIELVTKAKDFFDFSTVTLMPAEQLKALEEAAINDLRKKQGMNERKATQFKLKEHKGELYMPNPDQATITGLKEEREFVYLNLNGGDSWGYYHPKDNPTFIYNFKGEPTYKTSELLPEYHASLMSAVRQAKKQAQGNKLYLGFRDLRSAEYFNGWYDPQYDEVVLHRAKNERQIEDFLINYGQPVPDAVPIWSIVYDPNGPVINVAGRTVNTFRASAAMKYAQANVKTAVPKPTPLIERIIKHVYGAEMYEHFVNWLAHCFQSRTAPCTAWVASGTQGTGKGIMANNVLTPLFGESNVIQKRMEELEDKFNSYLENTLLCIVDEAQISDSGRSKMIMANLKNQITEPVISIRPMRQNSYEITNRVAYFFNSNKPDPVVVESGDRRFNVGDYQPDKLAITDAEVKAVAAEINDFALMLQQHKVDFDAVRTPKHTEAKKQMILVSRSSADAVADALLQGDMALLWDALPTVDMSLLDAGVVIRLQPYKQLLHELVASRRDRLTREELFQLFEYNVGKVPSSPYKLTVYLKHHGLQLKEIRLSPTKTAKGLIVQWKNSDQWFEERKAEIEAEKSPRLKVVANTGT